jgi:hypothetical protein
MPTASPHLSGPTRSTVRRLLAAAGILALAVAVPDESAAAQAVPGIGETRLARTLRDSLAARTSPRCLALRVVPGDTAASAMPRASGDSLVDTRMPRSTTTHPPCDRVGAAAASQVRILRMPDGTLRALPPTKVPVPPRP